jgi:hypothetical protein
MKDIAVSFTKEQITWINEKATKESTSFDDVVRNAIEFMRTGITVSVPRSSYSPAIQDGAPFVFGPSPTR